MQDGLNKILSNFNYVKSTGELRKDTIFLAGGVPFRGPDMNQIYKDDSYNTSIMNYSDTMGDSELREIYLKRLLREKYKVESIKNVLVTSGATAALFATLKFILKEDDEVIVLAPCWSIYDDIIKNCGAKPMFIIGDEKCNWEYDISIIQKSINTKTKAILFADPSNPLGKVMTLEFKALLLEIAKLKNIYIIADETYKGLEYDLKSKTSIMDCNGWLKHGIVIRSLSKYYRAPGIRIGFCIGSLDKINRIHEILRSMYLAPSSLGQEYSKKLILNNGDSDWHIKYCKPNLDKLLEFSSKYNQVEVVIPDSAFFTCIRINDNKGNFIGADRLFNSTGILCRDGVSFGFEDYHYMRISIDGPNEIFDEFLFRLKDFIENKLNK